MGELMNTLREGCIVEGLPHLQALPLARQVDAHTSHQGRRVLQTKGCQQETGERGGGCQQGERRYGEV